MVQRVGPKHQNGNYCGGLKFNNDLHSSSGIPRSITHVLLVLYTGVQLTCCLGQPITGEETFKPVIAHPLGKPSGA